MGFFSDLADVLSRCGLIHWTGVQPHTRVNGVPCLVECQRAFIHFGPHRDTEYGWEWSTDNERGHQIPTNGEHYTVG